MMADTKLPEVNNYSFTRHARNQMEKMYSLYNRQDYELQIETLKRAACDNFKKIAIKLKEDLASQEIDITEILTECSVIKISDNGRISWATIADTEKGRKVLDRIKANLLQRLKEEKIAESLPDRENVMIKLFYETYKLAKSSSNCMERIVRRLAPEYETDTVRTAILKKFVSGIWGSCKKNKSLSISEITKEAENKFSIIEKEIYENENTSQEEKIKLLVSKIEDSDFRPERLAVTEQDCLQMLKLMWEHLSEKVNNPAAYVKVDDNTFRKVCDFEIRNSTREKLKVFCDSKELEYSEDMSAIEILRQILDVYKDVSLDREQAEEETGIFYKELKEDFDTQMKQICLFRKEVEGKYVKELSSEICEKLTEKYGEEAKEKFTAEYRWKPSRNAHLSNIIQEILKNYITGTYKRNDVIKKQRDFWQNEFEKFEAEYQLKWKIEVYMQEKKNLRYAFDSFMESYAHIKEKQIWPLLKICNELADGCFKTGVGKTKQLLYYFAFLFEMCNDPNDAKRDITKNLFHDYYNDNLLRFIDEEYSNPTTKSRYENEPTGEGINYKNYMEVIYLYYLELGNRERAKGNVISPGELIDRANEKIRECQERAKKGENLIKTVPLERTEFFKEKYRKYVFMQPEEHLADYILQEYLVALPSSENKKKGMLDIVVSWEENTAYECYQEMIHKMEEDRMTHFDLENVKDEYKDKIFSDDLLDTYTNILEIVERNFQSMKEKDPEFIRVLNALAARVENSVLLDENRIPMEHICVYYHLLRALYSSKEGELYSEYKLNQLIYENEHSIEEMEKKNYPEVLTQKAMNEGMDFLKKAGFDIIQKNRCQYGLGKRKYENAALREISELAMRKYSILVSPEVRKEDRMKAVRLLQKIAEKVYPSDRRVTRTKLMMVHLNQFISDTNGADVKSLKEIIGDYKKSADKILEECRYQKVSEKNILDLFCLLTLVSSLTE